MPPVVLAHGASVEVQALVFTLGHKKCMPSVCVIIIL